MKYETLTKNVIDAVRNELTGVNKWQVAGASVCEFYGTEAALNEVKAQFIADAILPALDKRHSAALAVDLVRKGSKEYNALDASGVAKWESQNQAKKDARATAATMFNRIVGYAFPKEKTEAAPRDLKTRLNEEIAALVKACQKAEDAPFHVSSVIEALNIAMTAVNSQTALTITVK